MKSDSIILSEKLILSQIKTITQDKIIWRLILGKEGKEDIELDIDTIERNPFMKNDFLLYKPDLIDAFIDDNCIYAFIYKGRRLFFYEFDFIGDSNKFNKKNQLLINPSFGSIDNFGGFHYNILKQTIGDNHYFHINHGRDVGGKSNLLLVLKKGSIKRIEFSKPNNNIKDSSKILLTLNLEKNKEKIGSLIKRILIDNKYLDKNSDFKYLGEMDITPFKELGTRILGGITYFFYNDNNLRTKIIRYDNDHNLWLVGDYKESIIENK